MPQSLSAVYVHLVFSTKERRAFFRNEPLRHSLHRYLSAVSMQLDCPSVTSGGTEDHVHLLSRLGRSVAQAAWVKELKRVSNLWLQEQGVRGFSWQGGYADFSVSVSNVEKVRRYIDRQQEHHHGVSFQDELRLLLRKHQMEWDERYVWD